MKIYSVMDKEAENFSPPMAQPNDVAAMRMFTQEVNRTSDTNPLNYAPEHFSLWLIGLFNEETGDIVPEKRKLAEAAAVKRA